VQDLDSPTRPRDVVPPVRADRLAMGGLARPAHTQSPTPIKEGKKKVQTKPRLFFWSVTSFRKKKSFANDPTAGSPTVTLLRLLLPLNAQVWESSRATLEAQTTSGPVQIPH
jgi:hypothetical protein